MVELMYERGHNHRMFAAGNIERNLKGAIDSVIWRRGERYHAQGAVGACSFDADDQECLTVLASVHGSQTYRTEMVVDARGGEIHVALCDCPYAEENDVYCKHIAALGCALVERVRNIFGDHAIDASASAIAEALEAGSLRESPRRHRSKKLPASPSDQHTAVRARLASMGFDMSLATDTLVAEIARIMPAGDTTPAETMAVSPPPAQQQLFAKRYAVILKLGYNGARIHLHDTEQAIMPWVGTAALSRSEMRAILSDSAVQLNGRERALVTYLSKNDTWSASFDAYHALALAQGADIRIYRESFDEKNRTHFPQGTFLGLPMTMQREAWEAHRPDGTPLERTRFEIGMPAHIFHKYSISIGERGMVQVQKRDIILRSWSADAYAIMMRLKQSAGYARPERASTVLTAEETTRINEIIVELQRCFTLETELAPNFVVTKYDDPQQALRIDYDATASKLSLRGAVDYGCDVLEVSDEWYPQGWYGHGASVHLSRRTDPRQHPLIVSIQDSTIGYAAIDAKKEEKVYRALYEKHGFNKRATLTLNGTKPIERFLHEHWDALSKLGWKMLFTRDEIKYETGDVKADINVDLDSERDWLAFDLALYCGDGRVRLEDVIAFIEHGDECLKTEDGRLIRVGNRADLERLVRMLERFSQNKTSGAFEGRLYNAPEVADVASNSPHYRAQFAKSFDTFMNEAQSGTPVRKVKLPKSHRELLRPYQTTGVEWMHFLRRYRFGGILADEMGLGKTIQALSHVSVHTEDGETSLVVCPKTLLHNWKREAQTRFPELSIAVVEGTAEERKRLILQKKNAPRLLITSYPLAQRDIESYKARKKPFHYLLLDEAQSIKNPRTKNAHAVKAIPAEYRLALTGTPLENSVEELWSIFDFLMPGFLGHHASFQKHFGKPIMERGNAGALAHLKSKTSCFMLRRTKGEVLKELPAKIEQSMRVELGDDQNVLYQEVLARTRAELFAEVEKRGFKRAQIHILAALMKLRQICNHPALVEPRGEYSSAKLETCMDIVHEIKAEGRKVLIFSQFTSMLDIIADSLRSEHIPFSMLTGKTQGRQTLVDAFNADGEKTVFLISLKAGGTGLNLTSADTVIIFDPWWNPAVEDQAVDRAHRIGQHKTVNVYRLITAGTIEEKIIALQGKKRGLFNALVSENSDVFKKLTWEDVQDIFRQ